VRPPGAGMLAQDGARVQHPHAASVLARLCAAACRLSVAGALPPHAAGVPGLLRHDKSVSASESQGQKLLLELADTPGATLLPPCSLLPAPCCRLPDRLDLHQ
jgi:hypothetical protein